MNERTKAAAAAPALIKVDAASPALVINYPDIVVVKAGTIFAGVSHEDDTPLPAPSGGYEPGADYAIVAHNGLLRVAKLTGVPDGNCLGGFHFAPGGNATGRSGGDTVPAINPFSLWDRNFRPACPDPRGMTLIEGPRGKFWCDIYLLGADHLDGTSRFGVIIADSSDRPQRPEGGHFKKLDYDTAVEVMRHHGKGLLAFDEFIAAAHGVTERTVHDGDPSVTKLDAPRTSQRGVMQATGNLWVWGDDGDDPPRASMFGGSWWDVGDAGSRCASVAYCWPVNSVEGLGARGRGDHLQLA
jgi:hypothetical protein